MPWTQRGPLAATFDDWGGHAPDHAIPCALTSNVLTHLAQANDDMKNLLGSARIATLYLGNDLRIRRFGPLRS